MPRLCARISDTMSRSVSARSAVFRFQPYRHHARACSHMFILRGLAVVARAISTSLQVHTVCLLVAGQRAMPATPASTVVASFGTRNVRKRPNEVRLRAAQRGFKETKIKVKPFRFRSPGPHACACSAGCGAAAARVSRPTFGTVVTHVCCVVTIIDHPRHACKATRTSSSSASLKCCSNSSLCKPGAATARHDRI